jgi:hypothetical protein
MTKEKESQSMVMPDWVGFITLLGLASVVGGIGAKAGCETEKYLLDHPQSSKITSKTTNLEEIKLSPKGSELLTGQIQNYLQSKQIDSQIFINLFENPNDSLLTYAHQTAYDYLARGTALLQLTEGTEKPTIEEGKLSFEGREFDLSNQYDFHLASAIIDKSLEKYTQKQNDSSQIDNLLWLKDQNIDIRFENDSYAIFPPDRMQVMANLLFYAREEPRPYVIEFYRFGDNRFPSEPAGVYDCTYAKSLIDEIKNSFNQDYYDKKNCPILISNIVDSTGITHEIAHFLGYSSKTFNQEEYVSVANLAIKNSESEISLKNDCYLTNYAMSNNGEDFAETLAYYFNNGSYFRNLIQQTRWWDRGAYEVLKAKYDFFQNKFGDKQFAINGKEMTKNEVLNENLQFTLDKYYRVSDKSPSPYKEKGIHLRLEPSLDVPVYDDLKVSDDDIVEILEASVIYTDGTGEIYIFYKVKVLSKPGNLLGWIAGEWLTNQ